MQGQFDLNECACVRRPPPQVCKSEAIAIVQVSSPRIGHSLAAARRTCVSQPVRVHGRPSIASSSPANGDPAGIRKSLADRGVTYNLTYINDVLANVRGGARRGVIDQGRLDGALTIDLEKLAGWHGLSVYGNFFEIHNTGRIRRDYVGGINTIAAIEAVPTTRLWELWLEQKFWKGKASIKIGQLAADTEFFGSTISSLFLQSDWATITAANLPSGGPAYPLSTPGVRLKVIQRQFFIAGGGVQRRPRRPG